MAIYYKRDELVQDSMGNPISGVQIAVCFQPANTTSWPPSPQTLLYSDPLGQNVLTSPPQTDGNGMCSYYLEAGFFTVVYYSTQIVGQILALVDQIVTPPYGTSQYNVDSTSNGTITGPLDGSNITFTLSQTPSPFTSLVFMINGIVQSGWTVVGGGSPTIMLASPAGAPVLGDVLTAVYQIGL
jgi:hypothetical protein